MTERPTLGQRVRELRTQLGLTQQFLADRLGIRNSTIANVERDLYPVQLSVEKLTALAHALGIHPDELIALAGKLPPDIAQALRDPTNMRKVRQCLGL